MIRVMVPATSANCCIGFDSMGMALNWFARFEFEKADKLKITGCPEQFCNDDNLVVLAFKKVCERLGKKMPSFHLHIDSQIPFARGLGSSATCIVAGIMAANAWFDQKLSLYEMFELATEMEGHPDNVAPAMYGNVTACFMDDDEICMQSMHCPDWHGLAMIPEYPVSTHEARKVLPETLDYKECCEQVAHAIVFVAALQQGNESLLVRSAKDFLHEPFRKKLIREYDEIHAYCMDCGVPMWISGSGSTMLAVSKNVKKIENLAEFLHSFSSISCRFVNISDKGAYVENE